MSHEGCSIRNEGASLALDVWRAHEPPSSCLHALSNGRFPSGDALLELLGKRASVLWLEERWNGQAEPDLLRESTASEEGRPWALEDAWVARHVDGPCPQPGPLCGAGHQIRFHGVGQGVDELVPDVRSIDQLEGKSSRPRVIQRAKMIGARLCYMIPASCMSLGPVQ